MENYSRLEVELRLDSVRVSGELAQPVNCRAWILFAHGSGSSRKSPRNMKVSSALNEAGFGTLLFDLLSPAESQDRRLVFDIDLLASRLAQATDWLKARPESNALPMGYFGASTGAAAALEACAKFHPDVFAIASRGGRPDLAWEYLGEVRAPVLLIVGGEDHVVIAMNLEAHQRLGRSEVDIIPGAGHLFEESDTLEQVTRVARDWFGRVLDQYRKPRYKAA
jgi:putative phosphoribosyl transferase